MNTGLQMRTLPSIGGEVYLEAGDNTFLWDLRKKKKFLFGLIRPSLRVNSSGVLNALKTELEVFPISFLGFSAGRQYLHSNFDFPFLDCDVLKCKGQFQRDFFLSKIALGFKTWIFTFQQKIEKVESNDALNKIPDWKNVILGSPQKDIQIDQRFVIGKSFKTKFVGLMFENVHFQSSGQRKESLIALYQKNKNFLSYLWGAGYFRSSLEAMGFQLYFRMNFDIIPQKKLF